ncbi:hypothetical protein KBD69_03365 [Candidatus Woesebacteria bacterium]|nr:hypothetical protein [Candidatus Woesebacteria bacterium]
MSKEWWEPNKNEVDENATWFMDWVRRLFKSKQQQDEDLKEFLKPGRKQRKYATFDPNAGEDPMLTHLTKLCEQNPNHETIQATLIAYKKEHGYD